MAEQPISLLPLYQGWGTYSEGADARAQSLDQNE